MRVAITSEHMRRLPMEDVEWWDTKLPGLVLRCRATGSHVWRVTHARGQWVTLGRADVLKPAEARVKALEVLGDVAKGRGPAHRKADPTLTAFLDATYGPWAIAQRKGGLKTLGRLKTVFGATWGAKRLSEITPFGIESWRSRRLKAGLTRETCNRDLAALKAALSRAVAWGLVPTHPLAGVKLMPVDARGGVVRFLSADEEQRLDAALVARDAQRRTEREKANAWRRERSYPEWPAYGTYTDHVAPLVHAARHTGLRLGDLLALRWADVTFDPERASVCARGGSAKSGQTRRIPLNATVLDVLNVWRACQQPESDDALVFGVRTSIKTAWTKVLKAAGIQAFRFHDCRHHFASKLAMAGVDLNTIRELLGHSSLAMTLRYAHLAPEIKAAAVAKLVRA